MVQQGRSDSTEDLALGNKFIRFVDASPSPYHAVDNIKKTLNAHGFQELKEASTWDITAGGKYYIVRNGSSIVALSVGGQWKRGNGVALVGAHTDSPCLRIKPVSDKKSEGYLQVGVEIYGGGIWPTWFDRDLSVAGKVYVEENGKHKPLLVKIDRPLLRIPTLAVHLDRDQGTKLEINKETMLEPILGLVTPEAAEESKSSPNGLPSMESRHCAPLLKLVAETLRVKPENIEDFELILYDTQSATIGGVHNEFVFSPRLDNLNSCFCALEGFIHSESNVDKDSSIRALSFFDHEEIGSTSSHGAASTFLRNVLERVSGDLLHESLAKSFLLSADMAHAVHPNYGAKHETNHRPSINGGPVIKVNANQRYATNAHGVVLIEQAAKQADIPLQTFVVRNDSPCGSTIGPIISAKVGIRTLDLGNPQLSMHSIREMGGVRDLEYASTLYDAYFSGYTAAESSIEQV